MTREDHGQANAKAAWLESIKEMVAALTAPQWKVTCLDDDEPEYRLDASSKRFATEAAAQGARYFHAYLMRAARREDS